MLVSRALICEEHFSRALDPAAFSLLIRDYGLLLVAERGD
jgi:hypothetical protein